MGTPQGAFIPPLRANVYLHYVLDLWVTEWRQRHARGEMIVVRYADDTVMGFEHRTEAVRSMTAPIYTGKPARRGDRRMPLRAASIM
jgi:retron-type reverse transcriptase